MEKNFWQIYFTIVISVIIAPMLSNLWARNSFEIGVISLLTFISVSIFSNKFEK